MLTVNASSFTDMMVEHLPSGKFDTNELVLELTVIAYNILRMLGQETIHQGKAPSKRIVSRKRIRTVIQNIIHFIILLYTNITRCASRK